ncbi:hypothetical protein V6N13_113546 [Hibiscus sabdariffa]
MWVAEGVCAAVAAVVVEPSREWLSLSFTWLPPSRVQTLAPDLCAHGVMATDQAEWEGLGVNLYLRT